MGIADAHACCLLLIQVLAMVGGGVIQAAGGMLGKMKKINLLGPPCINYEL